MADIRDPQAFMKGRWAYDQLGYTQAFPRGISFTDIDAMVEINYHHLFLEHKEYHPSMGEPTALPTGQRIALERLAAKEKITMLHVAGLAETGRPYWIQNLANRKSMDLRNVSDSEAHDRFFSFLDTWAKNVQGQR